VPIQPHGSRPPFFCVHAHGGNVLNFNDLARHLGIDQPFFGLQAKGLDGEQPRHASEIREVQPAGPYLLGGYCFGGKVAYEMAQQLHKVGEEVALLAMIDAVAPGYRTSQPWGRRRLAQIRFHWQKLREMSGKNRLRYVVERSEIARARTLKLAKAVVHGHLALSSNHAPQTSEPKIKPYHPSPYAAKITVFAPTTTHSAYYRFEPHLGWIGLAGGGLEVYEIPGQVTAIISEPYVEELAVKLRGCLDQATALPIFAK
jgi:thioesterase domain-containing protein